MLAASHGGCKSSLGIARVLTEESCKGCQLEVGIAVTGSRVILLLSDGHIAI